MSYYNFLKEKTKNVIRNQTYIDLIDEMLFSMFDYENADNILYKKTLEGALRHTGYAMTTKNDNGDIITVPCSPKGLKDDYGKYTQAIGYTENGKTFERTHMVDCVIWENNNLAHADLNIERFADMLSEVDKSIVNNVRYSRLLPIPLAKDRKMLDQILEAQKSLENGTLKVILDENILSQLDTENESLKIVNLSDVNFSDKLQNLSMFHDDLVTRLASIYGHNLTKTPKKAQQSVDEINTGESLSHIIPLDNYYCRKLAVDNINKLYGTNLKVDFSPTWKAQLNDFLIPCDKEPIEEHIEEKEEEQKEEQKEEHIEEQKEEKKEGVE